MSLVLVPAQLLFPAALPAYRQAPRADLLLVLVIRPVAHQVRRDRSRILLVREALRALVPAPLQAYLVVVLIQAAVPTASLRPVLLLAPKAVQVLQAQSVHLAVLSALVPAVHYLQAVLLAHR